MHEDGDVLGFRQQGTQVVHGGLGAALQGLTHTRNPLFGGLFHGGKIFQLRPLAREMAGVLATTHNQRSRR